MHIELTDHLRCPMSHNESFVVLLPDRMDGRLVTAGHLGCPVCSWGTSWTNAIPDYGGGTPGTGAPAFDATAVLALLGLEGPGGWLALAGRAGALAGELTTLLPGVGVVAINPPEGVVSDAAINVLRSGAWPLKRHAMRGVVIGADATAMAPSALASALPGLRVAGEGSPPALGVGDELLADAGGAWVIRKG